MFNMGSAPSLSDIAAVTIQIAMPLVVDTLQLGTDLDMDICRI